MNTGRNNRRPKIRELLMISKRRARTLEKAVSDLKRESAALRLALEDREAQIRDLKCAIAEFECGSPPGQTAEPAARFLPRARQLRMYSARWARRLYRLIPVPMSAKLRCKAVIFRILAPWLRNTRSYQAWRDFESTAAGEAASPVVADRVVDLQPSASAQDTCEAADAGRVLSGLISRADAVQLAPTLLPGWVCAAPHQISILMIDEWVPTPDRSSGSFRLFQILRMLRDLGCQVELAIHHSRELHLAIAVDEENFDRYEKDVSALSVKSYFGQAEILSHLAAEGPRYSHVWLNFPSIAREYLPWVRACAVHARIIFDSIDLHHVRLAREAELTGDATVARQAGFYQRLEQVCCQSSDITIAISEDERRGLLALSPDARIVVIPNIHRVTKTVAPLSGRRNLLFIGGFRHQPNIDAVNYFVDEIFPRVQTHLPLLEFLIIGSNMPASIARLEKPGVRAIGFVEDPEPYFQRARAFVAPLRYGAGMKGKVGQALSAGLPSVTTPIGAEGMALTHERQVLIAASARDFADAVLRLCTDDALWYRLSQEGMTHIDRYFSPAAVRTRLGDIFSPKPTLP